MPDRRDFLMFGMQVAVVALGIILFCLFYRATNNILSITQHPDPILRQTAAPIHQVDEKILSLADDIIATLQYQTMKDFFLHRSMPKGLAAPQIGIAKKMVVCGLNGKVKVLINPVIIEKRGTFTSYEGCLSVQEEGQKFINRSAYVKLKYQGLDNLERVLVARNEDAALLEHEIDHLNGILNIDIDSDEDIQQL